MRIGRRPHEDVEQLVGSPIERVVQDPILSLHAIQRSQGIHTMRLAALVGIAHVIILVNLRSMHNFIGPRLVR